MTWLARARLVDGVPEGELARLVGTELVPRDFAVALTQGAMWREHVDARMVVDAVLAEALASAILPTALNQAFIGLD